MPTTRTSATPTTRGKLDLERVRLAHQPGPPKWTLATFGEWRTAEIWDRGYLMVFLDTQGGAGAEHYLLIRSSGVALEGSLWRLRNVGPDSYLGSARNRWSRAERHGPGGLVPAHLRREPTFYRWWTETLFTGEFCRRTCHDQAPNGDPVLQWRPGMSPSPSPSETPSPSPSGSRSLSKFTPR